MNAPSPGIVAVHDAERLLRLAGSLSRCHRARALHRVPPRRRSGVHLQIDAPDLAMERVLLYQDLSDAEFAKTVELHVAALNKALEGSTRPGAPARLLGQLGRAAQPRRRYGRAAARAIRSARRRARARVCEPAAAARSGRDHGAIASDHPTLVAGVIDSKSNFIEHPEVVAQRLEAVVRAFGDPQRVVAGVDCGFGTFVGWEWVTEDVVWAKLKSLREGAELASSRVFGKRESGARRGLG